MSNVIVVCRRCEYTCEHRHMHDAAHGIEGTHMAGSERFECSNCEHKTYYYTPGYEKFKFVLDGKDNG